MLEPLEKTSNMPHRRDTKPKGVKTGKSPPPGAGDDTSKGDQAAESDEEEVGGIEKILAQLTRMDAKFDTKLDALKLEIREGLKASEFDLGVVKDKVSKQEIKGKEVEDKVQVMTDVSEGLKTRSMVHGLRITELEQKIEMMERENRRNLIIVEGVPESEEMPSPEVIGELFADLKVNFDTMVCSRIHRRGKKPTVTGEVAEPEVVINNNRRAWLMHRKIVVGFKLFEDKLEVFKHLKNLQGLEKWSKVFISDDLTETQQRQVRDLRALAAYARELGYDSGVRGTFLIVDRRRYRYEDLNKLPNELSMEKAKTVVCLDGEGVAFQSVHSPLSNLYPCNVVYKDKLFLSAEGALQHSRAVICKRPVEARKIEFERDAYEVKRIASTLRHSPEWDGMVEEVLLEILLIKFTTNSRCREVLLETGNRKLFEATGDKVWACGLPLAKIKELSIPTPGNNRTGKAVEKVRGIIRAK